MSTLLHTVEPPQPTFKTRSLIGLFEYECYSNIFEPTIIIILLTARKSLISFGREQNCLATVNMASYYHR